MPATDALAAAAPAEGALAEAGRLMTVCNACRYCEGLCAVFPAMELRNTFAAGDLDYLANLCHGCGACYWDCQFAPPHAFAVNVPRALAELRGESYARYAWPGALAGLFARNGLAVALIAAASVALFVGGFMAANDPAMMFGSQRGAGMFYALMPHTAMATLFGAAMLYALAAIAMGLRSFWRATDAPSIGAGALWQAVKDTAGLRYLDGADCTAAEERPDPRRLYHHLTFYGFLLCFAATCVATLYHYLLGRAAPYGWYEPPVLLGIAGGLGLIAGPIGLLRAKAAQDPALAVPADHGMGVAFTLMLLLTSVTGMALLVLRATPAMGSLLALHLGVVFALFITLPYGKFVHGLYRFAALVRYALERRAMAVARAGEHGA
jgi:citrate/tricarballylate utilization protein